MELTIAILKTINDALNTYIMPALALMGLMFVFFFVILPRWIRKNGLFRGLYLWVLAFIPVLIWVELFWFELGYYARLMLLQPSYFRWPMIWLTLCPMVYFMTRQHGEKRGVTSLVLHLTVLNIGWALGNWFGMLFISLPILVVYYNTLYYLAHAIVPASNPESREERLERSKVFFWYTWGLQYPLQAVSSDDPSGRTVETRISGNLFSDIGKPGILWIKSHQAAALTAGTSFSRVEGPRVVFTKTYERLLEVVDLRTQLRTSMIDAVTKDGVRFKAKVFASFALDRDRWTPELYAKLFQKNPMLRQGMRTEANLTGIYPFSRQRIRAALMMRGNTSAAPEEQKSVYWDSRVINQVEVVASHVLSERRFDELWHPVNDGPGVSARDEIADQLKERLTFELLSQGVRLFAARVTNFDFSEYKESEKTYDNVVQQQIDSWRVDWESQKLQVLASAEAESSRLQQEARAYVQSILLTAIAEGLQETRIRYPNLPRHVIAMRFVGALAELARHQSEHPEPENEAESTALARPRGKLMPDKKGHYL